MHTVIKHTSILLSFFTLWVSAQAVADESLSNSGLRFSIITTAESSGSVEAMVVDGGRLFAARKLVHNAVLVSHPKGDFLWDSGIGREVEAQMDVFSFFQKQLFSIENVRPARDQLDQANYAAEKLMAIIPSHMHWDHASGLEDFSEVPVWLPQESYDEAVSGKPPAFVQSQFDSEALQFHMLKLENKPYSGFDKSFDIFADGSAVLVDLSGHTRGQLGLFLNTDDGARYFFIGDTTWVLEGVEQNRSRPSFVDWAVGVDTDLEQNARVIQKIHQLSAQDDKLMIVPAHDELVTQGLPQFPVFSS